MAALNAMQRALVSAGLAEPPKPKRRRHKKQFLCKRCKHPMEQLENTNILVCMNDGCPGYKESKNRSYYLFKR